MPRSHVKLFILTHFEYDKSCDMYVIIKSIDTERSIYYHKSVLHLLKYMFHVYLKGQCRYFEQGLHW